MSHSLRGQVTSHPLMIPRPYDIARSLYPDPHDLPFPRPLPRFDPPPFASLFLLDDACAAIHASIRGIAFFSVCHCAVTES